MTISHRKRIVAAICALGLTAAGVAGCSDKTADKAQASVEKAGDAAVNGSKDAAAKAKEAAGDAKEAAKDAADKAKDAADKAGDAAKDAGKDAAKAAGDAAKDAVDAAKDAGKDAEKAADKAADTAKDAGKDAAEAAKDAAADAKSAADDAVKDAKKAGEDVAEGDMVKVTDAAGASVSIPAAINKEATTLGAGTLGKLVNVKNAGDKWVASYSNGWHIAYTKDHSAVPVKGKIGQVWFENGNVTNPVGMPTAPEKTKADGNWVQSFTNGEIWANTDGTAGTETK